MNKENLNQFLRALQMFLIASTVIRVLWDILDQLIYGEIPPRLVKGLISTVWFSLVWFAYFLGREHEKQIPRA